MKLSELANHILEVGSSEKTTIKWFGSGIKIQEREDWAEKDSRCFLISRGTKLVRIDVETDDIGSNFVDIECIKREILKKENKSRLVREMGIIDDLEAPKESVKVEEAKKVDVKECVESLKEQMENEPLVPLGSCSLMHDAVNHPSHYNQGGIECIEAIESATIGKKGIEAVCVANVIKYLWRYELKGGIESVKKAKWYLEKLLEKLEEK